MKEKKFFKTLTSLIALLLLTLALCLPAFAEEIKGDLSDTAGTADTDENTSGSTENNAADTENVDNNTADTDTADTADTDENTWGSTENSTADTENVDNTAAGTDTADTTDTDKDTAGEENVTPAPDADPESLTEANPFEEIYNLGLENADKIFSVLAFLGTLIVGIGYKSGFLPLLRDALSKLKNAIDTAKEENDRNTVFTAEKMQALTAEVESIGQTLDRQGKEIERIQWQFEGYDALIKERQALRLTLEGQMDMLYAIFMQSTLPKYQKDEIGERISKLREELKSYEIPEN